MQQQNSNNQPQSNAQSQPPQPQQQQPMSQQQKQPVPVNNEPPKSLQLPENHLQMHIQQQNMIRQEVEAQSPLIGQLFPLAMLMDQFVNNEGFYIKIQTLMNVYDQYRKTRRDGCCFYRALNFCIFQKIVLKKDKALQAHMIKKIKQSKQHLIKAHFQGLVFEDLQQIFIEKLDQKLPKTQKQLLQLFRDPQYSNALVLMLRFITSGQIRNNSFLYQTFMYDQIPAQTFCQLQVQPIDKQADQIQIMALLNYLQVGIKIVYLDANKNKQPYQVILPESFKENQIVGELLYRPGHYDILYK